MLDLAFLFCASGMLSSFSFFWKTSFCVGLLRAGKGDNCTSERFVVGEKLIKVLLCVVSNKELIG